MRNIRMIALLALTLLTTGARAQVSTPDSLITSPIHLMARTYGDSIVLRWAAEDYVSWNYLNNNGINVIRIDLTDGYAVDTLVRQGKPLSLEAFRAKYPESDSLAYIAIGSLYGKGQLTYGQTMAPPYTLAALQEMSEEQNTIYGYTVLISEWRPDIASDLGMRIVDSKVKKGHDYRYIVQPTVWDEDSTIIFRSGIIQRLRNEAYKPEKFQPAMRYSLADVNTIHLEWDDYTYSSFEIERRSKGEKKWTRINGKPFLPQRREELEIRMNCLMSDKVPGPGYYEYRIAAHDAFGGLTNPTEPFLVWMPDIEAPSTPLLKRILILRNNPNDPMANVEAVVHFKKERLEPDFTGYRLFYRSSKIDNGQWRELTKQPLARTDTVARFDVSGLPTGDVTIAAYDTAMNVSYSMPLEMRLTDLKAPAAPRNLRAESDARKGTITITWSPSEDLDVEHYDLAFANDTTHAFLIKAQLAARDTVFVDTVALDANQKYVYYKVRATDYSTNIGSYSPWLQVERPHNLPPVPAHLDTAWVTREQIHVEWIVATDADMAYHNVLRRRADQKSWTLLSRQDADSVALQGYRIRIDDQPEPSRQHRYEYVVESWNTSKLSSGPTPAYSALISESWVLQATVKLAGDYFAKDDCTRLAWSIEGPLPANANCYLCVFRKGRGDDSFQYMLSLPITSEEYTDRLLEEGEQAEYYLTIQAEDGRSSKPSNTVKVKRGER